MGWDTPSRYLASACTPVKLLSLIVAVVWQPLQCLCYVLLQLFTSITTVFSERMERQTAYFEWHQAAAMQSSCEKGGRFSIERFGSLLSSAHTQCFQWAAWSCASYASDKLPDLQTQCTAVDGPTPDIMSAANSSSRDWPVSGAELHKCFPDQQQYWGLRGQKHDTKHVYCRPAADQDEAEVY